MLQPLGSLHWLAGLPWFQAGSRLVVIQNFGNKAPGPCLLLTSLRTVHLVFTYQMFIEHLQFAKPVASCGRYRE